MSDVSAVALFCEDVRRERVGRTTLIGVMPDVLLITKFPHEIERITAYFRIKFDPAGDYKEAIYPSIDWDGFPAEPREPSEPMPTEIIQRAITKAKERNIPFVTLTGRVIFNVPLSIKKPGQMLAFLNVGAEKVLCGALTFISSDRSTASEPPSEQPPPAVQPS